MHGMERHENGPRLRGGAHPTSTVARAPTGVDRFQRPYPQRAVRLPQMRQPAVLQPGAPFCWHAAGQRDGRRQEGQARWVAANKAQGAVSEEAPRHGSERIPALGRPPQVSGMPQRDQEDSRKHEAQEHFRHGARRGLGRRRVRAQRRYGSIGAQAHPVDQSRRLKRGVCHDEIRRAAPRWEGPMGVGLGESGPAPSRGADNGEVAEVTGASDEQRGYALGREDERARVVKFIRDLCRVTADVQGSNPCPPTGNRR